ncbi:hypothetical protein LINGRAHAP2_LOCUS8787, partial [Linum grandiflorum]
PPSLSLQSSRLLQVSGPWFPPRFPRLKIKVDGAVRPGAGGAAGWALRDSTVAVMHAFGTPYPG